MRNTVNTAFGLYGSLIRVWVLFFPFFLVLQPDDLQLILASKKHTNKTFFYRFMHNFLGNGLITRNGEQWHTHRRLIQPTFHLSFLERFISTFADASQSLFESLDPLDNQEINVTKYVNNCVLDILNGKIFDRKARHSLRKIKFLRLFRSGLGYTCEKKEILYGYGKIAI